MTLKILLSLYKVNNINLNNKFQKLNFILSEIKLYFFLVLYVISNYLQMMFLFFNGIFSIDFYIYGKYYSWYY